MAAGITLRKDALGAFRAFLEETLGDAVTASRRDATLKIDGAVSAGGFNLDLAALLMRAGPYGAGHPEPVLALPAHQLAYADPVGANHIRLRFKSGDGKFVNAIAFRAVGQPLGNALLDNRGRAMHVAGGRAGGRGRGGGRGRRRGAGGAPAGRRAARRRGGGPRRQRRV